MPRSKKPKNKMKPPGSYVRLPDDVRAELERRVAARRSNLSAEIVAALIAGLAVTDEVAS